MVSFERNRAFYQARRAYVLLDPCAGEGEAAIDLRCKWFPDDVGTSLRIVACEMEQTRFRSLASNLTGYDQGLHADAFRLTWNGDALGAALLLLNPPYDQDQDFARLEHRFLDRFTPALAPGGALLFIIPVGSLRACAKLLARAYAEIRIWRFPEPEYSDYRQIVVLARRTRGGHAGDAERLVEMWANPGSIPILPEVLGDPLVVPHLQGDRRYGLNLSAARFDQRAAENAWRPWEGQPLGTELGIGDLIGRSYPTALPPKAAHLALALAAGHFNGHRLRPNRPAPGWPSIVLKGLFAREQVMHEEKTSAAGEVTGVIMVEQPRLRMSALRLDTFEFLRPQPGIEPGAPASIESANTADIMTAYSDALADLMARQFPPMHDPANKAHLFALPDLPRELMAAQRHGILAALKLLARGENPIFPSEMGTGKTTMALTLLAALSPRFHGQTLRAIRGVAGFEGVSLPMVRRSLVVCPPHLLDSWQDEARACWPSARLAVLRVISDLDQDYDVGILSRETAKLGHGFQGVEGLCPRCGAPIPGLAEVNARQRRRCEARHPRPLNLWAEFAEMLAPFVINISPATELGRLICGGRRILRQRADRPPARRFDLSVFGRIADQLVAALRTILRDRRSACTYDLYTATTNAIIGLARAGGAEIRIGHALTALGDERTRAAGEGAWSPYSYATDAAAELRRGAPPDPRGQAVAALQALYNVATWESDEQAPICGEPLFQASPDPRRFPLARYICRHRPDLVDFLVIDEAHEMSNLGTAQQRAAHRLVELGCPSIALSGSMMSGYASSLFANWWALNRTFRRSFKRDEKAAFVQRYGLQKLLYTPPKKKGTKGESDFGAVTDRQLEGWSVKILGEVPGVVPLFLLRHLLPTGILIHMADLEWDLPPCAESRVPLELEEDMDYALVAEYRRLEAELLQQIKDDMFTPLQGKLWGALSELPSYLDRATEDQGNYEIRYPEDCGAALVAAGESFPASWATPKERWLLARLEAEIAAGRKVLVFLRHTGSGGLLPRRLLKLIQVRVTPRALFLDAGMVPTQIRERWINEHVIARKIEVMIVNPNAVRTGLNCLTAFSTAVWYEFDYSAQTYRQANGRIHRPGQTLPAAILFPFYPRTIQQIAEELIARKVTASLQVDGLSMQGALEAAGAGDDARAAVEMAMQMGEAIYRRLARAAA